MGSERYALPPTPTKGEAVLITQAGALQSPFTQRRDYDARTALTQGLADYLGTLDADGAMGRLFGFYLTFPTWAEPETVETMPAVAVYAQSKGTYEASQLTPHPIATITGQDPVLALLGSSELSIDLVADLWTADPEQRANIVAMFEDSMTPVEWRYGVLLELPYYFNQRATYELMDVEYLDDADQSQQRIRRALMTVRARIQVSRLITLPLSKPRSKVEIIP